MRLHICGSRVFRRLAAMVLLLLLSAPALSPVLAAVPEEDSLPERVETAKQDIRARTVGKYGMTPIYGRDVAEGQYPVHVDSSSPYFRILEAELVKSERGMEAQITISSLSYLYIFPGTAEEAERARPEDYIRVAESEGRGVFHIAVEALNTEIPCAAFSKRRKQWYDRSLVFFADSLPEKALSFALPDYDVIEAAIRAYDTGTPSSSQDPGPQRMPEPVSLARSDGEYSIEVTLTGGSGRASVSSPTLLRVQDGKAYARLLWSSPHYDYMLLEGARYENRTLDGGSSCFEIPITAMDVPVPVIADTTAMGDPVEIAYTLTFYAETIGAKGLIPQEAAKKVLLIALAVIVVGGVLDFLAKRKRRQ